MLFALQRERATELVSDEDISEIEEPMKQHTKKLDKL